MAAVLIMMTIIYLIRHALTADVGTRLTGRNLEVGLSPEGYAQADALANRLVQLPLDALYSSPQTRALQTAHPLAAQKQLQVFNDEAFNEIDFGEWTGMPFAELSGVGAFHLFNQFRSQHRIPGGETMAEAQLRMLGGLAALVTRHPGQTVGVVSHSDMIKATLAYYLGVPIELMQRLEVTPASVSGVVLYAETARVFLVNHCGAVKDSLI